jgi:hypothetical protein
MKRLHVHVAVDDLQHSIGFYSALFAAQPIIIKSDYAKWMLDDPRVNFAISARGRNAGLDHLGIQVENKDELGEVYARLHKAGGLKAVAPRVSRVIRGRPATLLYAIQSAAPTFKVQASAAEISNRAKIKRAMSAIVIQPASLYMSQLSSFGRTTWPRRAMCVGLTTLSQTRT